jgi:hypothetical protein
VLCDDEDEAAGVQEAHALMALGIGAPAQLVDAAYSICSRVRALEP